jgi:AcrR family transcriptional regulator
MQRPDEAKRRQIMDAAARLFANREFHEVRLEDVADAAKVGKGTLYVYFSSKDALYLALIREAFGELLQVAVSGVSHGQDVWEQLRTVVRGVIRFGMAYPDLFRVMRRALPGPEDPAIQEMRCRLTSAIEQILADGNRSGRIDDPHPEITSQFFLSFIRGVLMYPPAGMTAEVLEEHMLRVVRRGIGKEARR